MIFWMDKLPSATWKYWQWQKQQQPLEVLDTQ
jgi:hypothetical protein